MKKTMLNCNISSFEVLSVVLFSALTFGSTGAVLAQNMAHPSRERVATVAANVQPASNAANSARAAFQRADANHDGQLSAEEARHLPAVSQRFEEMDTDRNGQLSLAEFDKGIQKY
ncbi:MAG: EF-hand domain-containing protein [Comamonas sp.]|jgi:hypothetical protein|nr:EF-hand domain-containing protein [Comamonas sp.]